MRTVKALGLFQGWGGVLVLTHVIVFDQRPVGGRGGGVLMITHATVMDHCLIYQNTVATERHSRFFPAQAAFPKGGTSNYMILITLTPNIYAMDFLDIPGRQRRIHHTAINRDEGPNGRRGAPISASTHK